LAQAILAQIFIKIHRIEACVINPSVSTEMVSRTVAFLLCLVSVQALVHREQPVTKSAKTEETAKPAKKEEEKPATKEEAKKEEKPATKEELKKEEEAKKADAEEEAVDNFHEEIIDQADPEFDRMQHSMQRGHRCISKRDAANTLKDQMQTDARHMTPNARAEYERTEKTLMEDGGRVFDYSDKDKSGCLDKAEFEAMGEWEGSPPGFEKMLRQLISKKDLAKREKRQLKFQFNMYDTNGDHQLSKSEVYNFVSENMPHADLSATKMAKMFADADENSNGFVAWLEFRTAGERIDGDGKGVFF